MIDTHSHLLPGIDDGSRSIEQSQRVCATFAEKGVTGVVLTPHARASEIAADRDDPLERRDSAFDALRAAGVPEPQLWAGFEIMLDQALPADAVADRRFALAGSRYFLVEFPLFIVSEVATRLLKGIVEAGGVPIVAHPERYNVCSVADVSRWRGVGAKMQIDATTLTRPTTRGRRARQLLIHGLADVIAADNHGGPRCIATGADYLRSRESGVQAWFLSVRNPASVVADEPLREVPPAPLKETFIERFKRLSKQ